MLIYLPESLPKTPPDRADRNGSPFHHRKLACALYGCSLIYINIIVGLSSGTPLTCCKIYQGILLKNHPQKWDGY
jgi:hypothetical protein